MRKAFPSASLPPRQEDDMLLRNIGLILICIALIVTAVIIKGAYDNDKSIMLCKRIAFIIDASSSKIPRIYHYPDCKLAHSIPRDKRVILIGLDEVIEASNYREDLNEIDPQACRICKPPIPAEWAPEYPDGPVYIPGAPGGPG